MRKIAKFFERLFTIGMAISLIVAFVSAVWAIVFGHYLIGGIETVTLFGIGAIVFPILRGIAGHIAEPPTPEEIARARKESEKAAKEFDDEIIMGLLGMHTSGLASTIADTKEWTTNDD